MSVRDDLIAAKALIDTPEKWGKGNYEPRPGCFCVLGAVRKATGADRDDNPAAHALRRQLPRGPWWDIASRYNDDPSTSHADIMALFDRAIAAAGDA